MSKDSELGQIEAFFKLWIWINFEDNQEKIKVIGQIMELESKEDVWLWTGSFLRLDTSTTHAEATLKQFLIEIPAGLIHPVAPLLSEASTTPTWSIDNEQLTNLLNFAWEMLDPEGSKIYETFEMLPQVSNTTCLPYHNSTGSLVN
ncbi:hypothetical protein B0H14DRAFT_2606860 [Mycena olivaceomarginata]|nr:hypothetical protein B0H14DRAFT_2606860 [Mycena olivaceomarginata]